MSVTGSGKSHGPPEPERKGAKSFIARVRESYGTSADPGISLEAESQPAVDYSDPVLTRFAPRQEQESFGRYRVKDEIGRGGMGAVLRVWDADLRRHLAMKVLLVQPGSGGANRGADARALGRFLEEAQVTGQLDHPGIVPVHELGLDSEGRVYFTMKLVQGQTLRAVIDLMRRGEQGWNLPRAISVVHKICEAMAYAHEKGVIHRDLKPANVMVGRFGAVYVMDWGVARVLGREERKDERGRAHDGRLEQEPESTPATLEGDVLGTPAYMSPEQAGGRLGQVGPQSDVYSLGSILYHVLTGRMPYSDASGRGSPRNVLVSLMLGPPKPVHELASDVPAELAAICEKAMARDPQSRYASMLELAQDLQAWLEGRVVRAHATGALIELRKWVQRNRGYAASLAAAALILVIGLIGTSSQYVRAEGKAAEALTNLVEAKRQTALAIDNASRALAEQQNAERARIQADEQRKLAEKHAEETQQVADFQAQMLANLAPAEFGQAIWIELRKEVKTAQGRLGSDPARIEQAVHGLDELLLPANATTVAQRVIESKLMRPALDAANEKISNLPLAEATLLISLSATARRLGLLNIGAEAAEKATAIRRRVLGDDDPNTLSSIADLAGILYAQGRISEAQPLAREAVERHWRKVGEGHSTSSLPISSLALQLMNQGLQAEAERLLREVLDASRRPPGDTSPETLHSIASLAGLLRDQGRFSEAEPLCREALAILRRTRGDEHSDTLVSISNLAFVLQVEGKLEEAESLYREVLDVRRRTRGNEHAETLVSINTLASTLQLQSKFDESEQLYREALALRRHTQGDDHPHTFTSLSNLGTLLQDEGKFAEAEALLREALEGRRRVLTNDHPSTLQSISEFALLLRAEGRLGEAEDLLREAVERRRLIRGDEHPDTLLSLRELGECLTDSKCFAEAETSLLAAEAGQRKSPTASYPKTVAALAHLYEAWNVAEPEGGHANPAAQWELEYERVSTAH